MIGASSFSGQTLVAYHFPVRKLPPWNLHAPTKHGSVKQPGRLCSAGLTRAASLPESDSPSQENGFRGGRRNFSNSHGSLAEDRTEEEGTSDGSSRYDSTPSPEETSSDLRKESSGGHQRQCNSFLPNTEPEEEDEEEGDNLHRYDEDSSFALHGNFNWLLSHSDVNCTLTRGDPQREWSPEGTVFGAQSDQDWLSNHLGQMDSVLSKRQSTDMCRSGNAATSCPACGICGQHKCSPERLSNSHTDSSCNSSDGILVNFCVMYNRSNNPATPHDLSSPAHPCAQAADGSVLLDLLPVLHSPASSWSPQCIDSNRNLCPLEPQPLSSGLSSLEVSDLAACLHTQGVLAVETNQKYYKLVTCDLSSQSPSPAWSSQTSCAAGQDRNSLILSPPEGFKEGQCTESKVDNQQKNGSFSPGSCRSEVEAFSSESSDHQVAGTSAGRSRGRLPHSDGVQDFSHMLGLVDSKQGVARRGQAADDAVTPSSLKHKRKSSRGGKKGSEKKPERPTSLPIQPFVLLPAGKPQTQVQHLGSLLDKYITRKAGLTGKPQRVQTVTEKRSPCSTNAYCPKTLEGASSSETCSTCTPSPAPFLNTQICRGSGAPGSNQDPQKAVQEPRKDEYVTSTSANPSFELCSHSPNLQSLSLSCSNSKFKGPHLSSIYTPNNSSTSHTPPTLSLTADPSEIPPLSTTSLAQSNLTHDSAAPAADSIFPRTDFITAALPAVAPLSSLSSLFSSAVSSLHLHRTPNSSDRSADPDHCRRDETNTLSDTELCFSSDVSYDSMSISHLQRRGLLRSVSAAVDLITAHFSRSREPDEKMRLGNSFYSPTISGLVLEHLCPAIQSILSDGLRDHKLDFVIGQRRNHPWNVVEVATRTGPSTRVLASLVHKIRQCSQLSSHCMRLRAFIMGLLNLRALEFWLSHLHSQKDLLSTHYHSWGFLFTSLGCSRPLFEELLLLLQPLSALPFDLNLLLEPRLLELSQLRSKGDRPPEPCSALLLTSWPELRADTSLDSGFDQRRSDLIHEGRGEEDCGGSCVCGGSVLDPIPEIRPREADLEDGVVQEGNCVRRTKTDRTGDGKSPNTLAPVQAEGTGREGRRWSKLFGAASSQSQTGAKRGRHGRPSQWLLLNSSQLELLARSIRSLGLRQAPEN